MSINLTDAAHQEFDSEVKHQYQGMGKLRKAVTTRTNVTGDQYKFVRMGRGMANQKASAADVTPMNISHARQIAYLANWNAPEYTDIFDDSEVNYQEVQELAQTIAKGITRREDQIIIDIIEAGGDSWATTLDSDPDTSYTYNYSGTGNFSVIALQKIRAYFQGLECDSTLHCMCDANAIQMLLRETKVGSVDYNLAKPLVEGDLTTKFMGFKFHIIGERAEGGLTHTNVDNQFAYCWAEDAVGLAVGIDLKTEVNYVPQKTAWLSNGLYKAGAVLREPQGVARIQYDSDAAVV